MKGFAKDLIVRKRETAIDEKNRIILGAATYAEKGDKLAMLLSKDKTYLKVFRRELIETEIKRLLELGKVAKTLEEQEYVEQNLALYKDSVVALPKVDAQRRLSIPKEVVEELKLQGHVYVVGAFDSVEIYPSREAYEATLKQKKLK